jgi:hypothetical protein
MKPAKLDLGIRPGATFVGRVFLALDAANVPVDLTGYVPFAQVRPDPDSPVLLDLQPVLIAAGAVSGFATADPSIDTFTLTAHGLKAGMAVKFSTSGVLPVPLTATDIYIVLMRGLAANTFRVMTLTNALAGSITQLDITTAGTGNLTVTVTPGQIFIPEITDENTEPMAETDAVWDLMLQDPSGRRLAPFVAGKFPIARGVTDPAFL